MNNCTVRFYIGLLFHLTGAIALGEFGLRTDSPTALAGALFLTCTSMAMAYALRRDALPSRWRSTCPTVTSAASPQ